MDKILKKQRVFYLIGVLSALFMLVVLVGCGAKPVPVPEGENLNFYGKDQKSELRDNLADLPEPEQSAPQMLGVADMLALPAGTVVQKEQVNREKLQECFVAVPIPDEIFQKINGKSYIENPYVSLDDLRYLKVLHYNFEHGVQVGEIIVSTELTEEFLEIFQELFDKEYEIYSMFLVEDFWTGDALTTDDASCVANNTSGFSYRMITMGGSLSRHAYGKAIDVNPVQNPFIEYSNGVAYWYDSKADPYIDRAADLPHMIRYEDACFIAFDKRGYTWGGDWTSPKDYQHFEK
jgi:hypothetical protein